jgi:hypothetical protein
VVHDALISWNDTVYGFQSKELYWFGLVTASLGLQVVVRSAAQLAGRDCVVAHCTNCRVYLMGCVGALRLMGLRSCTVVTGPVTGATFVDDLHSCTLVLASYQVGGWVGATDAPPVCARVG